MSFFDGFGEDDISVGSITLHVRCGGNGPPVLLLHGHPRTHATWHQVAPMLAARHTVVCPDLRGYGRSTTVPDEPRHAQASKRAMAHDCVALMRALGHERFDVVGHDRGACVAFRLALDHPEHARTLTTLDGLPIGQRLEMCDAKFASMWWHWFFLGNPAAEAERVINLDPDAWYHLDTKREQMGDEAWEDLRNAVHNPAVVHAMCEDYRAGLEVDREHDDADRAAGRRVTARMLALWALRDDMEELYEDPLSIWQDWADDVRGFGIDCGHHFAEEAPGELVEALNRFWDIPGA
ncbi:MAG: alpha/beta hydrolase [Acidimicrobiia bacterium]|nr:alpha/beta hydrolase [Acidimicrobiia bacterium]